MDNFISNSTHGVINDSVMRGMIELAESPRVKALLSFMYDTKMDRYEIVECKIEDVDFNNRIILVQCIEGSERVEHFSECTKELLIKYLSWRAKELELVNLKQLMRKGRTFRDSIYLFSTIRTAKISYSTIFKTVTDASSNYFMLNGLNAEVAQMYGRKLYEIWDSAHFISTLIADGCNFEILL